MFFLYNVTTERNKISYKSESVTTERNKISYKSERYSYGLPLVNLLTQNILFKKKDVKQAGAKISSTEMTYQEKRDDVLKIWTDPAHPASFSGPQKVY